MCCKKHNTHILSCKTYHYQLGLLWTVKSWQKVSFRMSASYFRALCTLVLIFGGFCEETLTGEVFFSPTRFKKLIITCIDIDWQIHFDKMNDVNPVLGPNGTSSFRCPIRKKQVKWEEKDVFNPAAVVKDNMVYLLYRAEDTVSLRLTSLYI